MGPGNTCQIWCCFLFCCLATGHYSARITFAASLGSIQNIFNSSSVCPKWEDSLKYAMFPFLGIFSFVSNFFGRIFKHSTMPRPSKKSAQVSAQCHADQGVFSTAPPIIFESDSCSAYNSSEGQTDEDSMIPIPHQ